jgi:hypothetical protein
MSKNIFNGHRSWLEVLGKNGQMHNESPIRIVILPPHKSLHGWDISEYHDRWDLLEQKLKADLPTAIA